ncbi:unnamed protein product [Mycena citricolor]|uniref:Uncharacterized protein n=1 Tax=Mycena citricolor TaxID=2018698 RepID=A0AAD2K9M6_9AGAR|nr:unnamed protein product [Mycena citricolor]
MRRCRRLWLSLLWVPGGRAFDQSRPIFQWGFTQTSQQALSSSLPSCHTFPIVVTPLQTAGVPPFYMMAFAVGGAPVTSLIGSNPRALEWTVQHSIGSELLLQVVDSQGTSGGVDNRLYTVIGNAAGTSTQCVPTPTSDFIVSSNVTSVLETCQPWGLSIQGGTPPYNVTLAALNAPEVTNVTLGADDDLFTYINRAESGTRMIAAVSDLSGRWASGSPFISTQGSSNVTCPGLESTSSMGNNTMSLFTPTAAPPVNTHPSSPADEVTKIQVGLIAGATGAVILLLFALATFFARRRYIKRRQLRESIMGVRPFLDHGPASITTSSEQSRMSWYFGGSSTGGGPESDVVMPASPGPKSPGISDPGAALVPMRRVRSTERIQLGPARQVVRELPPPYVDRTALAMPWDYELKMMVERPGYRAPRHVTDSEDGLIDAAALALMYQMIADGYAASRGVWAENHANQARQGMPGYERLECGPNGAQKNVEAWLVESGLLPVQEIGEPELADSEPDILPSTPTRKRRPWLRSRASSSSSTPASSSVPTPPAVASPRKRVLSVFQRKSPVKTRRRSQTLPADSSPPFTPPPPLRCRSASASVECLPFSSAEPGDSMLTTAYKRAVHLGAITDEDVAAIAHRHRGVPDETGLESSAPVPIVPKPVPVENPASFRWQFPELVKPTGVEVVTVPPESVPPSPIPPARWYHIALILLALYFTLILVPAVLFVRVAWRLLLGVFLVHYLLVWAVGPDSGF